MYSVLTDTDSLINVEKSHEADRLKRLFREYNDMDHLFVRSRKNIQFAIVHEQEQTNYFDIHVRMS